MKTITIFRRTEFDEKKKVVSNKRYDFATANHLFSLTHTAKEIRLISAKQTNESLRTDVLLAKKSLRQSNISPNAYNKQI